MPVGVVADLKALAGEIPQLFLGVLWLVEEPVRGIGRRQDKEGGRKPKIRMRCIERLKDPHGAVGVYTVSTLSIREKPELSGRLVIKGQDKRGLPFSYTNTVF